MAVTARAVIVTVIVTLVVGVAIVTTVVVATFVFVVFAHDDRRLGATIPQVSDFAI